MTTMQVILLGFWVYTAGVASNTHPVGSGRGFPPSAFKGLVGVAFVFSTLVYFFGGA